MQYKHAVLQKEYLSKAAPGNFFPYIDVIDSRLLYEGMELERLKSLYDYYIALSELFLATGNPILTIMILEKIYAIADVRFYCFGDYSLLKTLSK